MMEFKDIKLIPGMSKDEVNSLINGYPKLLDEYLNDIKNKNKWMCKCGNIFYKSWYNVRRSKLHLCPICSGSSYPCDNLLPYEQSFQYFIENIIGIPIQNIWDYDKNKLNPQKITPYSRNLIWAKCLDKEYHPSFETIINRMSISLKKGHNGCPYCAGKKVCREDSFAQWGINKFGENFLEKYWDYEKNQCSPWDIAQGSRIKVYIKCPNIDYHPSYLISAGQFKQGYGCSYCSHKGNKVHPKDSFAQYHINNTCNDFLEKYWDYEKNNSINLNPWELTPHSNKKVWIKCNDKKYHGSYLLQCNEFSNGQRCPYCNGTKIHFKDSFGYRHFEKILYWDKKNNISPFKLSCHSQKRMNFYCFKCHKPFKLCIATVADKGGWCPYCRTMSKGEKEIASWLDQHNITYLYNERYFDDLYGDKQRLRPDFILPKQNIWIEFNGKQHSNYIPIFHGNYENFQKQKRYDNLKRVYAKEHNFKFLEIWYYDINIKEKLKSFIQL